MQLYTVKSLPVDIHGSSGNIIKKFEAYTIIKVSDEDGEFLLKNGLALKTVEQP